MPRVCLLTLHPPRPSVHETLLGPGALNVAASGMQLVQFLAGGNSSGRSFRKLWMICTLKEGLWLMWTTWTLQLRCNGVLKEVSGCGGVAIYVGLYQKMFAENWGEKVPQSSPEV